MRELRSLLTRALRWTLVPIAAASAASLVMMFQGGFGGGHGTLDWVIGLLGLPAVLLLDSVAIPEFFQRSDLLLVAWFPALINAVLWFAVALFLLTIKAHVRPVA